MARFHFDFRVGASTFYDEYGVEFGSSEEAVGEARAAAQTLRQNALGEEECLADVEIVVRNIDDVIVVIVPCMPADGPKNAAR